MNGVETKAISPEELRRGNLVTDEFYPDFENIITVDSINDKGINLEIENSHDYPEMQTHWIEPYYEFEKLRGIPLNEEWLDKKIEGVERIETFTVIPTWLFDLGRERRLSITIQPGNTYIWLQSYDNKARENTTDLICLFNSDYDGQLYVHKFQEIVHALTGTELTLKEPVK